MAKRTDPELDLLMEVVSHPGWKVVRKYAQERIDAHLNHLLDDADTEFDLIKKEVRLGKIAQLNAFMQEIDAIADKYAKGRG